MEKFKLKEVVSIATGVGDIMRKYYDIVNYSLNGIGLLTYL